MDREELEERIEEVKSEIDSFEVDIESDEVIEMYEEYLDCDGPVDVCGTLYDPSRILRELDPIAYRCGLMDYTDGLEKESFEEYRELLSELEGLENELELLDEDEEEEE